MDRTEFWAITGKGGPQYRVPDWKKRNYKKEILRFIVILSLAGVGLELLTNWSFHG